MNVKASKFTKNHKISRKWAFFTEEGQFHGKCHGREIVMVTTQHLCLILTAASHNNRTLQRQVNTEV